jgi:hypothetical protein
MNTNERNDSGWRIPREGTTSYDVYNLMQQGYQSKYIAALLNKNARTIAVLAWKIRHPEEANEYTAKSLKNKKKMLLRQKSKFALQSTEIRIK